MAQAADCVGSCGLVVGRGGYDAREAQEEEERFEQDPIQEESCAVPEKAREQDEGPKKQTPENKPAERREKDVERSFQVPGIALLAS